MYSVEQIKSLIRSFEIDYNIPAGLLEAVISKESNFDPGAVGAIGEIGLAQLRPGGAIADYEMYFPAEPDYFEPEVNLKVAAWYLGEKIPDYLSHFGLPDTIKNRIVAYNAGIGRAVDGVVPEITRKYIRYVKDYRSAKSGEFKYAYIAGFLLLSGLVFFS